VTAFVDTNVLVRHLTGDRAEVTTRATAYLGSGEQLLVADLVVAETAYVLESLYEAPRAQVVDTSAPSSPPLRPRRLR
jgi:predicted nucleic acid-binding protein